MQQALPPAEAAGLTRLGGVQLRCCPAGAVAVYTLPQFGGLRLDNAAPSPVAPMPFAAQPAVNAEAVLVPPMPALPRQGDHCASHSPGNADSAADDIAAALQAIQALGC